MSELIQKKKAIRKKDMVLFSVSAILLLDTLAATASMGAASIFWWFLLGALFYVPFGLICAEMGCAYPEQGGIYAWVRDAFGGRWGSRISWSYWVNVAIWMPAIYILFAGVFKQLFMPGLTSGGQIVLGIVLAWVAVWANVVTLNVGKWVPNIGAIFKVIISNIIAIGAYIYVQDNGMANPLNTETLMPDWGASLQFIPAIIYGMLGFELISASADDMENPRRDVPKSILIAGSIVFVLYVIGTVSVLAAIPAEEIDLLEGLVDTLMMFFGGSTAGNAFVLLLGVMALYTFFSNGVTWAMGGNRAAAEAAEEGELPAVFAIESEKRKTPVGAAVMMGVVSTIILGLYGFLVSSNEDLFWSLFAFSGVIFLLPYVGMMFAFIKLRLTDGQRERPFKIMGGNLFACALALICAAVLIFSIVLFMYTPSEGIQWPVFIGSLVAVIAGEIAMRVAEYERKTKLQAIDVSC